MISEQTAAWALARIKGLGPANIKRMVDMFGSAKDVFESFSEDAIPESDFNAKIISQLRAERDWAKVDADMRNSIPEGAQIVAYSQTVYPDKLRQIADPPPYFFYRGDPGCLEKPALAIVGSRKPSDYGRRMAARIAGELAAAGVTIVSGLAFGVDAFAHTEALETGGLTVAVFGSGLDIIYPSAHRELAGRISHAGCLISEFPRGTKPERFNFPVRNRIISGISEGVLVVEAGRRSGALVTARLALEHNREVLAIPGSVDNELSFGPNDLIKQGAVPVTSADDVFRNFGWHRSENRAARNVDLSLLSGEELNLYDRLSIQPIHFDEIARKIEIGPAKMAELLLKLEIKGFILRKPGNFVVRI